MMRPKVRYETAPLIVRPYPFCDSCAVDVCADDDGWICPQCGTTWGWNDADDDAGTLYADWSGESVDDLPMRTHDDGWKWVDPEKVRR